MQKISHLWRPEPYEVNLILIEHFIFYQICYDCNLRYVIYVMGFYAILLFMDKSHVF